MSADETHTAQPGTKGKVANVMREKEHFSLRKKNWEQEVALKCKCQDLCKSSALFRTNSQADACKVPLISIQTQLFFSTMSSKNKRKLLQGMMRTTSTKIADRTINVDGK